MVNDQKQKTKNIIVKIAPAVISLCRTRVFIAVCAIAILWYSVIISMPSHSDSGAMSRGQVTPVMQVHNIIDLRHVII